ncbi:MAG: hypothetical protein Q9220_002572 [cf. Caloplaca sp. 1 TL-2023]
MSAPPRPDNPPPAAARCQLFFYEWPCGHRQYIDCRGCDSNVSRSLFQAHLAHQPTLHDLSPAAYSCPQCSYPAPWEGQPQPRHVAAGVIRAALEGQRSDPDLIRHRSQEDAQLRESPWRRPEHEIEFTTPGASVLARIAARNIFQSMEDVRRHDQEVDDDPTPRPTFAVVVQPATPRPDHQQQQQQQQQQNHPSRLNPNAPEFVFRGSHRGQGRGE